MPLVDLGAKIGRQPGFASEQVSPAYPHLTFMLYLLSLDPGHLSLGTTGLLYDTLLNAIQALHELKAVQ